MIHSRVTMHESSNSQVTIQGRVNSQVTIHGSSNSQVTIHGSSNSQVTINQRFYRTAKELLKESLMVKPLQKFYTRKTGNAVF